MSTLEPPKPNPPIKRDTYESLEWTRRAETLEVCKSCFCKSCKKCNWTGFVQNQTIKGMFK